jgi:hypothetical protein
MMAARAVDAKKMNEMKASMVRAGKQNGGLRWEQSKVKSLECSPREFITKA